jgi:hypothetical protein
METTKIVYDEKYTRGMQILDYIKEMKFENVRVESLYGAPFYYVNNIKNVCKFYGTNNNVKVSIKIESIIFKDDILTIITKDDIIKFNNVKLMDEVTINGNKKVKVKIELDLLVFVDKSFENHIISIELPDEKNNRFIAVYDSIVNVREITNVEKQHESLVIFSRTVNDIVITPFKEEEVEDKGMFNSYSKFYTIEDDSLINSFYNKIIEFLGNKEQILKIGDY